MTTTRVAASLCFTRFSLSAARLTSTATAACRSDLRLGFPLLRADRRVTGEGLTALPLVPVEL
jgi:hypothetical protein